MKCDIYEKTTTTGASGQQVATWTLQTSGQECDFSPDRTNTRVEPTQDEADRGFLFLPFDAVIDYGSRIYNVVNRHGEVLAEGPLEVMEIRPFTSYTGKIVHLQVKTKGVVEK